MQTELGNRVRFHRFLLRNLVGPTRELVGRLGEWEVLAPAIFINSPILLSPQTVRECEETFLSDYLRAYCIPQLTTL